MSEAPRPVLRPRALVAPLALSLALGGCRSCEEQPEKPAPSAAPRAPSAAPPASGTPPARPLTEHAESALSLRSLVDEARKSGGRPYRAPTEVELSEFSAWVTAVATAAVTGELPERAPPRGFVGRTAESGRFWLLAESEDDKRGAGLVVVRVGRARPFVIETPHTFFDRGTLELGLLAFERLEARALLLNTLPRSSKESAEDRAEDAQSGESAQDLAHVKSSFYSSAHAVFSAVDPELVALQIHGFKDERADGGAVVVSASETRGNARAVVSALRAVLPPTGVLLYPDDIRDLGATKNAQAALSRASHTAFLHVELSATLRNKLKSEHALAERVMDALGASAGGTAP